MMDTIRRHPIWSAAIALFVLLIVTSTFSIVPETRQGIVVQFGKPVRIINRYDPKRPFGSVGAGIAWRIPFVENIVWLDKRVRDIDMERQQVLSTDQLRLEVDAFARYRIEDPLRFYQTLGSIAGANSQLAILLNSALRRVLGEKTMTDVVRDERQQLMTRVREQLDREAQVYGINVIDVRIRRADLPEQNSQAVYQRMQTERQREAAEFRAQGSQKSQEIRAKADRDVTVLLAEANSRAEQVRGEGDGERNRIYAEAYGKDLDFFAFYRSMQAYQRTLDSKDTTVILSPDSKFLKQMNNGD